jgi:ElaB/YqjD/DUF883 family membrane-anchored ribosome-binding protein
MQTQSGIPETGANGSAITAGSVVSREFHRFIADVEDLIKSTTSLTGDDLARARAKLGERVAAAKASASEMGAQVTERVRQTAGATDAYVHEQPWTAIGIGAALGMLVGWLVAHRN